MYYLAVIGQPRNDKGQFKGSVCMVTGPYIGRAVIPIPMDYLSDYGNRKEKIYRSKIEDIHLFVKDMSKDEFVKGYI